MPSARNAQLIYISHGGGPLPILGDASHQAMITFMQKRLPEQLRKPAAILVVSAHWEETVATLLGAENPGLFYDYYGFPEEAYAINYPLTAATDLAKDISELLASQNLSVEFDTERGFDHGVFIPLRMSYPQAGIPVMQLSLLRGLNPAAHLELGKALRKLLEQDILVIGSGFSFHNMRAFDWQGTNQQDSKNTAFQDWLIETCTSALSEAEREQRLSDWQAAPAARYCHPREEHLLPLHVCQGMAGDPAKVIFDDYILGKRALAFHW